MNTLATSCPFRLALLVCGLLNIQQTAHGVSLQSLFEGSTLTVGQTRFDNWELVYFDSTSLFFPVFSQVAVVPLAEDLSNPGFQIQANNQLSVTGLNALDMYLKFRVSALPGGKAFAGHSLGLTGITFTGMTGTSLISQEIAGSSGNIAAAVVLADNGSNVFQLNANSGFTPQTSISVSVNIFMNGLSDTINLASYTQRFAQTGPAIAPGDFDVDGDVDGRDFLIWQRGGSPTPLSVTDLHAWKANYGIPLTASLTAVPEPSAVMLVIALICLLIATRIAPKSHK